jgi:DNA topoisomerase-1
MERRSNVQLSSRRAARTIRACQELPGQLLFQYENDRGELTAVTSTDINVYLREVTGEDITAKDYRTWAGTVLAAEMFHELVVAAEATSSTGRKKQLREVINQVAYQLGNTPTICRKCYIHSDIQNAFLAGKFKLRLADPAPLSRPKGSRLDIYEAAVLAFLRGFKRKGRPPA